MHSNDESDAIRYIKRKKKPSCVGDFQAFNLRKTLIIYVKVNAKSTDEDLKLLKSKLRDLNLS